MTIDLSKILDDDLLAGTGTDGVTYKVTGAQFRSLMDTSMPWDNHDGGVFHVINGGRRLSLTGNNNVGYTVTGQSLGRLTTIARDQEVVVLTPTDPFMLFWGNYSNWEFGDITNTSKVTNFSGMFGGTAFNNDLSKFDMSAALNVDNMFYSNDEFNQDLDFWDMSKVRSAESMFKGCEKFNGNIDNWDTGKITKMNNMFENCTIFNRNISGWNTSSVMGTTAIDSMFSWAENFNQDLSQWCVANIPTKPYYFDNAAGFEGQTARQPQWATCPRGENIP